jgi:tyrosine-specific transport protein
MAKRGLGFYEAVATLVGTTIGAGIMGIPYVVAKAGILAGIIDIIVLGAVILMINLYVGEISLRTKKTHQLAGFAELYLGKKGKAIMAIVSFISIIGALVAYIIGLGEVLSAVFGGSAFFFSLLFFAVGALLVYFDLYAVKKAELYLNIFVLLIIGAIIAVCFFNFDASNLVSKNLSLANLFIPYGVILFAFVGASAIPAMEVEIRQNKKMLKKAIVIGTVIPFVVYFLFMLAVVGVTGQGTSEIATIGLGEKIGEFMIILGNFLPIFTMSTSFFILGLALKWMFHYDYGMPNLFAWMLTCFIPLGLFLAGARSFISVIGLTGAIAGGMEGILLVLIAKQAKKKGKVKPDYQIGLGWIFAILLILLFTAGIVYQFVKH